MTDRTVFLEGRPVSIGKILCVGRNYAAHAEEMGAGIPDEPVLFLKPHTALVRPAGGDIHVPAVHGELHHEIELVLLLGAGGRDLSADEAARAVAGLGVGVDLTLRAIQARAKEDRAPWTVAKGFDRSAPVGDFVAAGDVSADKPRALRLSVNGETRQEGNAARMIFPPTRIISFASRYFTLEEGDLFFTGTPPGVGPLRDGDRVSAEVEGLPGLDFTVRR